MLNKVLFNYSRLHTFAAPGLSFSLLTSRMPALSQRLGIDPAIVGLIFVLSRMLKPVCNGLNTKTYSEIQLQTLNHYRSFTLSSLRNSFAAFLLTSTFSLFV